MALTQHDHVLRKGEIRTETGTEGRPYEASGRPPRARLWKGHPVEGKRALGTYILDVVEAKWGAPPRVLQGLRGEGLIMAMDEAAKREETLGWGHWDTIHALLRVCPPTRWPTQLG